MKILHMLALALTVFGMAGQVRAGAWCDHYRECCYVLLGLYEEQPIPAADIANFQAACDLADVMAQMGAAGETACFEAEEAISDAAHQHWLEGRLGAYPADVCWAQPFSDTDGSGAHLPPAE